MNRPTVLNCLSVRVLGLGLALLLIAGEPSWAVPASEVDHFFEDCPSKELLKIHDENSYWDLHTMFNSAGFLELELWQSADWILNLLTPGIPFRPFTWVGDGIVGVYRRLPDMVVTERVGEFFDAFQLREISFGDASTAYTVATGGLSGPGSGMIIRVNKLIDWTQHIVGDVNRLLGWFVRQPDGLVSWSVPERTVDSLQWVFVKTTNQIINVQMRRFFDTTFTALESGGEFLVNLPRAEPHAQEVVFIRIPIEIYEAYQPWFIEHRRRVVIGTEELFREATHAQLGHGYGSLALWNRHVQRLRSNKPKTLVIMVSERALAKAPEALKLYVVPAAWILEGSGARQVPDPSF